MVEAAKGFDINTNILETNVINLAFVIGVLFYFGKDTVINILEQRKSRIVGSIEDAENRYREAQQKLEKAQVELKTAEQKAQEIRSQGDIQAQQAKDALSQQVEEQINQLEESSKASYRLAEQQAFQEIQKRLTEMAFTKARQKLKDKLNNKDTQKEFIDYQIRQFNT